MKRTPIIILMFASALSLVTLASAQVPQMINYQGLVAVGDPPVNFEGTGEFAFALVNEDGSTSYWSNDGTSTDGSEPTAAVSLTVTKGLYSVLLGANMTAIPNSVFANSDVHLRVWFNDGSNGSQLLTPDQRIAAVGYAMVASTVADGAITSDKLADDAVTTAKIANNAVTGEQLASGLELEGTFSGAISGTFSGDGSGLTNIPASAIVSADSPPPGMVLIPEGDFLMGSDSGDSDESPPHTVTVSAFYLDKYEVNNGLWDEVKIYAESYGYTFSEIDSGVGVYHPVNDVNWYDCVKWCNARSEMEGLTPVYYTSAIHTLANVYKTGDNDLAANEVNWSANGYRLPTEAEWEKASRGTLVGNAYPWGNTITGSDANYYNSGDPFDNETTPVGYYDGGQVPVGEDRANGYGLYDMAGNVWEWCWDWYDESWYNNGGATTTDTRGPNTSPNDGRVLRGGSWFQASSILRCANRNVVNPLYGFIVPVGFRSARGL